MSCLSVLIVNYQSGDYLASCLRSLAKGSITLDYDIFIINNDCPEDLTPILRLNLDRIRIIQNHSNRGFAAAINQGYMQSQGPLLLVLNPDVRIEQGALETLVATLEGHPDAGIVFPLLRNPDGSLQYSCRRFYTVKSLLMRRAPFQKFFANHPEIHHHLMADWDHQTLCEVEWGLGAAMLIRRAALDNMLLFDERFYLYFEDVDLCRRMWEKGWKVLYDPAAQMIHHHQRDSIGWGKGAKRQHFLSLIKFLWKYRFNLRVSLSG